ncbi:MAG: methylated-DNA--[protein]-cysteine S-methyltransferase, partial [Clostridia bacterium]
FDFKIEFNGTAFQNLVWSELLKIPYGDTITYGELARRIGKPNASRAVGNANGKNPLLIVVPCHRVVATSGIGGFSCGIDVKQFLLQLESRENKTTAGRNSLM